MATHGDRRAREPHLHGMWAVGRRRVGASTRTTSTPAAPASRERMLELSRAAAGRAGARAGVRARRRRAGGGRAGRARTARSSLSDVAPEMTAIAAARAEALGLDNVDARACSTSRRSTSPTAPTTSCSAARGCMFAPDPARAAREIAARAAARRPRRARGLGPARAQPVARARVRRGQRPDRRAGAAARRPRAVLARGRRRAGRAAVRRRPVATSRVERARRCRCAPPRSTSGGPRATSLAGPLAKRARRRCPRTATDARSETRARDAARTTRPRTAWSCRESRCWLRRRASRSRDQRRPPARRRSASARRGADRPSAESAPRDRDTRARALGSSSAAPPSSIVAFPCTMRYSSSPGGRTSVASKEIVTRGSRRTLSSFRWCGLRWAVSRSSPSTATHTRVTCGAPVPPIVARWPSAPDRISCLALSGSEAMRPGPLGSRRGRPAPRR